MSKFKKGQVVRCTQYGYDYDVLVNKDSEYHDSFSGVVIRGDDVHKMGYSNGSFAADCFIILKNVPDPEEELKRALDQLAKDLQG